MRTTAWKEPPLELRPRLRRARERAAARPGGDARRAAARRHRVPGRCAGARGRAAGWARRRVTLSAQQPGGALHVDRRLAGVAGAGASGARAGRTSSSARRHLRPAVRSGVVRSRLRLLRARASRAAGRGAQRRSGGAQAGRDDHGDRGRPRLGVLPPRQRRGRSDAIDCLVTLQRDAGGDALIGREVYPLLERAGFADVRGLAADGLRRRQPARSSSTASRADVHGDDRGRPRAGDRRGLITPSASTRASATCYATAAGGGTFAYTFFKGVGDFR